MGIPLLMLRTVALVLEVLGILLRRCIVVRHLLVGSHILVTIHIVGILRLVLGRRESFSALVCFVLGAHILSLTVKLLLVLLGVVILGIVVVRGDITGLKTGIVELIISLIDLLS
jgi:hypothetical protein